MIIELVVSPAPDSEVSWACKLATHLSPKRQESAVPRPEERILLGLIADIFIQERYFARQCANCKCIKKGVKREVYTIHVI
jgi:hypothetical protein